MEQPPPNPAPVAPKAERRHKPQIIGLLGLTLVLAAVMIGAIVVHQDVFGSRASLYFIADDVTGLSPGTAVRISGFRIGKVENLELLPDQTVRVSMSIEAEHFGRLRADARANVVREQLRPAAIDLRAGSAPTALSAADPRIAFTRRGTLNEIADDLRNRFAPILDDMRQLSGMARDRKGDMDQILQNANTISASMAEASKQLREMAGELRERASGLGAQSTTAMEQANRSLVRMDGLLRQAERGLDTVNGKLPSMLEKTEGMLTQLDAVLRDGRTISGAAAQGLPPLLRGAPPLVEESREIMQGLRDTWVLRTLLPAPPSPLLPVDSHDAAALRQPR